MIYSKRTNVETFFLDLQNLSFMFALLKLLVNTMEHFNPTMVTLAREARGYTQQDLAERINTQKAFISKIEHGELGVSEMILDSISKATSYPLNFFFQPGTILPMNLSYRKRKKVPAKIITPIEAKFNIVKNNIQFLTRSLNKQAPLIPTFKVTEECTPNIIAKQFRQCLNLSKPVIDNLAKLLEQQGIIISCFEFGSERVDSRSILTDDQFPIIFLNKSHLGDRLRFSLAFQLGHLVMHTYSPVPADREISHEANLFAAELLMPEEAIREDFKDGVSLPLLAQLKRKWKVSMISLLYRADDLGFLTPNQKRYLVQQFNQAKIRRREPVELDVAKEEPQLIRQMVIEYCQQEGLSLPAFTQILALELEDYLELYC
ncbi:MAG: ImmA/IrrE family metallo-endopeptidase [Flavobacterium sp.]|nr:MAG: ImmA/IrrE family metallo-endopeptidase [Flavobacterium sp.]